MTKANICIDGKKTEVRPKSGGIEIYDNGSETPNGFIAFNWGFIERLLNGEEEIIEFKTYTNRIKTFTKVHNARDYEYYTSDLTANMPCRFENRKYFTRRGMAYVLRKRPSTIFFKVNKEHERQIKELIDGE